jgi:hypothetical protein
MKKILCYAYASMYQNNDVTFVEKLITTLTTIGILLMIIVFFSVNTIA